MVQAHFLLVEALRTHEVFYLGQSKVSERLYYLRE
nr:MAG TPA: hypothetical protein [Bacteriophage sp.]